MAAFRIHLLITKDEAGLYSAVALNLPGAGSCGGTEAEAIENAREAITGVLEEYIDSKQAIPWRNSMDDIIPPDAYQMWIALAS